MCVEYYGMVGVYVGGQPGGVSMEACERIYIG